MNDSSGGGGGSSGGGGGGGGGNWWDDDPEDCSQIICGAWSACNITTTRDCYTLCTQTTDGTLHERSIDHRSETKRCCNAKNGTCNSGDFTAAADAISSGTCKYKYSTYTTTNASCGGGNITCYHRK